MIDVNTELMIAKKAALQAGNYLLHNKLNIKTPLISTEKDIKIEADIGSEKIIKDLLSNQSNIKILAEESGMSSDDDSDIFWVVDPLDGTANYLRDIPICCVSIALISNLQPILGVIFDFNNNELYEGSIKTQALMNEEIISVSNIAKSNEGILITGLPNNTDYTDNALDNMIKGFLEWR